MTPTHLALRAFETALEPKQLMVFPGGHFDAYTVAFARLIEAQVEFLNHHLP